jgi:DNA ligase-1
VRLFTRTLDDITARLPEVVAALAGLPVRTAVFDGELIALRPDGRPYAFQDTAARAASETTAAGAAVPLSVFLFDVLHLDGADLIDLPDVERRAALEGVAATEMLMPRLVTGDVDEAEAFFLDAVARGHEGVVVKSPATPYAAGRRGAGWIKVKPRHTLDLVVLAVEWGHGRRKGWLSNLHLGARDPETGGWVMLGKTFKGLTDELLTWQTARLLELEEHRDDWTVYVRPELVVEIAFDGVQRSPRYPGGVALRFARVLRYREDKAAAEADTIDAVLALAAELLLLLVALAEGGGDDVRARARHRGQASRAAAAEAGETALGAAQADRAAARLRLAEHLGQLLHRLRRVLGCGGGRQGRRARPVT